MSSPSETVNQVMGWLSQVLGVRLPSLPFPGVFARLAGLFGLTVTAPLPDPSEPLPWTIPVADSWVTPIPGIKVTFEQIRIQVAADAVASPPSAPAPPAPRSSAPDSRSHPRNPGHVR